MLFVIRIISDWPETSLSRLTCVRRKATKNRAFQPLGTPFFNAFLPTRTSYANSRGILAAFVRRIDTKCTRVHLRARTMFAFESCRTDARPVLSLSVAQKPDRDH